MADVSRDDVLKLARLARLELTDDEVEEYSRELSSILQYVQQIQDADVAGLEPTSQVTGLTNVLREDLIMDNGATPDELLRVVPSLKDRHVKVKRMIS